MGKLRSKKRKQRKAKEAYDLKQVELYNSLSTKGKSRLDLLTILYGESRLSKRPTPIIVGTYMYEQLQKQGLIK